MKRSQLLREANPEQFARGQSTPSAPQSLFDPEQGEYLAAQRANAKPQPAKVTLGDGTAVDATPENIQQAVDRFLRRPTTQKTIKVDPAKIKDDPESFINTIADAVVNAKTRGGRPLMQGVSPDDVKQVLMNNGAVKVNPVGPAEIVAKADETLESALESARMGSEPPPPPKPPTPTGGTPQNKAWNAFLQAWNLPRSLLASLDFSYPLRQGGMLIRHGSEWANSFGAGLKAFRDDEFAQQVMDAMFGRQQDGSLGRIHISTLDGGLKDREEDFASALLGKIPGFRRSAQANIVFINKLRVDTYDSVIRMWDRTGQKYTQADLDALANYINRATGRGTLGDFEEAAGALATGIFSPRHLASRVQAPGYLIHKSRLVRNEAWKDVTVFAGAISGLLALADLSGVADVELDPRAADFGKLRVGNTRVDLWTGYQQIGRLIALVGTGELKSSSGAIYGINAGDALLNFVRGKLHPTLGAAADQFIFGGKNVIGEQIDWSPGEAANRLVPLAFQSMYDAINEGDPLQIALSGLGLVGGGVQTYASTSEERNKLIADMGFTDPTTGESLTEWHKLSNAQKAEAKTRNPELATMSKPSPTTEARDAERAAAWETLKKTGDFDAYFDQYSNISDKYEKEFAAQEFPELKNPGEWAKKLQDFYDKSAAITNSAEKQAYREEFEASLNPDEQAAFKAGQQSSDPNYRKLQQAMDMLQPRYYDLREAVFEELKAKVPRYQNYATYSDVFESGTSADQKEIGTRIAAAMREVRIADPQADAMLYILGRSEYVLSAQAKAIVDATLAKEGINKPSPGVGRAATPSRFAEMPLGNGEQITVVPSTEVTDIFNPTVVLDPLQVIDRRPDTRAEEMALQEYYAVLRLSGKSEEEIQRLIATIPRERLLEYINSPAYATYRDRLY